MMTQAASCRCDAAMLVLPLPQAQAWGGCPVATIGDYTSKKKAESRNSIPYPNQVKMTYLPLYSSGHKSCPISDTSLFPQ